MSENRIPPHNAEAECAVLGAMMRKPDLVIGEVSEQDFYMPHNRMIYIAACSLQEQGKPVDEVTIVTYFDTQGTLKDVGGVTYITDLQGALPVFGNLPHYIGILREMTIRRKMLVLAQSTQECAYTHDEIDLLVSKVQDEAFDLSESRENNSFVKIGDVATNVYMELSQSSSSDQKRSGTETGFIDLDAITGKLKAGQLVVLAARPGVGKSALATGIAVKVCKKGGVATIHSLEMSKEELIKRILCAEGNTDMNEVVNSKVKDASWNGLAFALQEIGNTELWIDDTASITTAQIRSRLRRLKARTKRLDLVIIDYLQLISFKGKKDLNKTNEVGEMTRSLKILARELEVPIVLLSQLNRDIEKRPDKKLRLSDLRDSGNIEQDADIVIFINDKQCEESTLIDVDIAKNRNGPRGSIRLVWDGPHCKFLNHEGRRIP